jgi:hypothetical protein
VPRLRERCAHPGRPGTTARRSTACGDRTSFIDHPSTVGGTVRTTSITADLRVADIGSAKTLCSDFLGLGTEEPGLLAVDLPVTGVLAGRSALAVDQGGEHVVVVAGDDVEPDALGAHRGALTDLGAATEAFAVVGLHHADRA